LITTWVLPSAPLIVVRVPVTPVPAVGVAVTVSGGQAWAQAPVQVEVVGVSLVSR
jgi:hypothetical protein